MNVLSPPSLAFQSKDTDEPSIFIPGFKGGAQPPRMREVGPNWDSPLNHQFHRCVGGYLGRQRSKSSKPQVSGCQTQRGTEHSAAGLRGPAPPQRKSWRGWQQQDGLPGPSEQQPALASGLSSLSSGTTHSIYSHITFLQPPCTQGPSMVRRCTGLGLSSMSPSLLSSPSPTSLRSLRESSPSPTVSPPENAPTDQLC